MKTIILSLIFMLACFPAYGRTIGPDVRLISAGKQDTAESASSQTSSGSDRWLNVDIALGRQFSGTEWSPYELQTCITAWVQDRPTWFPLWLDGSIAVAWSGETDADGHRAGPGTSFVELNGGVGQWWDFERMRISVYTGGGLNYTWAKLELPDMSKPPLPISEFLGHPVYPDMEQAGNFWGGYLRAAVAIHVTRDWHIGIGTTTLLTTNGNILGRSANASSTMIGLIVGAGQ